MIIAFIAGSVLTLFNIMLSLIAKDWNIAFILSGTAAIITIVIASLLRNAMVVFNRRSKAIKEEAESFMEAEKIAKMISIFGFPNIILTVILFFRLYGIEYILERI